MTWFFKTYNSMKFCLLKVGSFSLSRNTYSTLVQQTFFFWDIESDRGCMHRKGLACEISYECELSRPTFNSLLKVSNHKLDGGRPGNETTLSTHLTRSRLYYYIAIKNQRRCNSGTKIAKQLLLHH